MIREEKKYDKVDDLELVYHRHTDWFDFARYKKIVLSGKDLIKSFFDWSTDNWNDNAFRGYVTSEFKENFDIVYDIIPDKLYDVYYREDTWPGGPSDIKGLTFVRVHEDRIVRWIEFDYMSNCRENYERIKELGEELNNTYGTEVVVKGFHNESLVTSDMTWEEFHIAIHGYPPGVDINDDINEYRNLLRRTRVIGHVHGNAVCNGTNFKCPICGGYLKVQSMQFPKYKGGYEDGKWTYHYDKCNKVTNRPVRFECVSCGTEVGVDFDEYCVYEAK